MTIEQTHTRTLDYLAPGFLQEAHHWYAAVMRVIAPRLQPNGGNIIAVQLDNEIGMLSWISNAPDLTDNVLADFVGWLSRQHDEAALRVRYPFGLDNPDIRAAAIRSPKDEYAAQWMRDLGHFMRDRYARYVAALRSYAEECGVKDVPFLRLCVFHQGEKGPERVTVDEVVAVLKSDPDEIDLTEARITGGG